MRGTTLLAHHLATAADTDILIPVPTRALDAQYPGRQRRHKRLKCLPLALYRSGHLRLVVRHGRSSGRLLLLPRQNPKRARSTLLPARSSRRAPPEREAHPSLAAAMMPDPPL
jgi:hypothetical protein